MKNLLVFIIVVLSGFAMAQIKDACLQPHSFESENPCRGMIPLWTYNAAEDNCLEFIYGGCGGNDNLFATEEECKNSSYSSQIFVILKSHNKIISNPRTTRSYGLHLQRHASSSTCASVNFSTAANIDDRLKVLEEKEKTDVDPKANEKMNSDSEAEEEEEEDTRADDEMDDENDYGNSYFDNGEAYDEEDDNFLFIE